ncbi:MAG: SpoIIE family protein phosphatase [Phycisphaeraceae bacterium]
MAIGFGLAVLLIADYRYELATRLREKHIALAEEAEVLSSAIEIMWHHGIDVVQAYIDAACAKMQDVTSPGHHIVVRSEDTVLQARVHMRASPEMLRAVEEAAQSKEWRAKFMDTELIIGASVHNDLNVYVSEYMTNVRAALRGRLLGRLAGLFVLGIMGAVIVNVILIRFVTRPIERLADTVRRIGSGQLGIQTTPFKSAELNLLAGEINTMSQSLASADRERREQMAKAIRIQNHLQPAALRVPGLRIAHVYQPATEVAGDYYDFVPLADSSWLIGIADVTGHGVPAAMGAAILKTLLLSAAESSSCPAEILRQINARYCSVTLVEDFASMLLLRWVPSPASLEYASAGHETGYLLRHDGALQELASTGLLLGIERDADWETRTLSVSSGDRLLLYTDGVSESPSLEGKLFGRHRVIQVFRETSHRSLDVMMQRLTDALTSHRGGSAPTDDVTVIGAEVES